MNRARIGSTWGIGTALMALVCCLLLGTPACADTSIGTLMARRGVFFVPFEQDDFRGKPTSCVADFEKILPAVGAALDGRQLQPMVF